MIRCLPLRFLLLGLFLTLGALGDGTRQLALNVTSTFVQEAGRYAISKIACPCAATHDDNHEHHELRLTDIRSAVVFYGDEETLLKIDGHVHTKHETGTHAHECSFYLMITEQKVSGLKRYTCSKFLEDTAKHSDTNLQPDQLKALTTFAQGILATYNEILIRVSSATREFGKVSTYSLHLSVHRLKNYESNVRECVMFLADEPSSYYKYSLIKDSCH